MKSRLLLAAGLLTLLGGCATYDYTGGPNGYYRGTDGVQYRYPAGYYGGYGGPYYDSSWMGLYGGGYSVYPGYGYRRPPLHRPPPPPPRPGGPGLGHRPPPNAGGGPRPPRPTGPRPGNPPSTRSPSPWRDLNSLRQGNRPNTSSRPPRKP